MPKHKNSIRLGAGVLLLCLLSLYYWRETKGRLGAPAEFDAELASLTAGGISTLPDSTMNHMNLKARNAVSKGDYALGMKIVDGLSKVNGLSPEQAISLRNTVQTMKIQMAEAALGGDTNAEKAIAYFKTSSVLGR